jgi:uncharacterized protein (DUF305 family)
MIRPLRLAAFLTLACAAPAFAQIPPPAQGSSMIPNPAMPSLPSAPSMPSMPGMTPAGDASASTKAFKDADEKMMRDMNRPMSGDADRDFVAGMLPHHQGAVDMAQVELRYGKDPEMRRLARTIVAAQQKEIAEMQTWQRRHPQR